MEVAIDKTGSAVERRLIFVDKNRDMFMTQVRVYGTARKTVKLCKSLLYSVLVIILNAACCHTLHPFHLFSPKILMLVVWNDLSIVNYHVWGVEMPVSKSGLFLELVSVGFLSWPSSYLSKCIFRVHNVSQWPNLRQKKCRNVACSSQLHLTCQSPIALPLC